MRSGRFSLKKQCLWTLTGLLGTMAVIVLILCIWTKNTDVLICGLALMLTAGVWVIMLIRMFGKQLAGFTSELCIILDDMIDGNEQPKQSFEDETLFARILNRLSRLYGIMQENRRQVEEDRKELQGLVSDIAHQVKTPVSNLKMITDTLLTRPVSDSERMEFLTGMQKQTDKLTFLFQALVKTSRLETGAIRLRKTKCRLYDTLAHAMSGIWYQAEKKNMAVTINCPEELEFYHDSKWTAEAMFNLLDNAVKYTPDEGSITVTVEQWERYVKIVVADTGKGILEKNQPLVFQRFYREEEVQDVPGVGIGLYLARKIISRQGGYIKVSSEPLKGSAFSVFLFCELK